MARGRPRESKLSQSSIIDTALEQVDKTGNISLHAIAKQLDVHVSSLYNHIDDKQHLLKLIREHLFSQYEQKNKHVYENIDEKTWDELFRIIGNAMYAVFTTHPKLVPVLAAAPVQSNDALEGYLLLTEPLLELGLDAETVSLSLKLLDVITLGAALEYTAAATNWPADTQGGQELNRAATELGSEAARTDAALTLGLEFVIQGIKQRLTELDQK